MNWSSISKVVGDVAPTLGTLLGGPAGAAAGTLISAALGTSKDPESIAVALQTDPAAAAKLAELQINAKVQLQQLAVNAATEDFKAEVADRDSARKLAMAQPNDLIRPTVTVLLLIGSIAILFMVFTGGAESVIKDPTASSLLGIIVGYWFSELKTCLAFYFGTTKESNNQNKTIAAFAVADGTVTTGQPKNDSK